MIRGLSVNTDWNKDNAGNPGPVQNPMPRLAVTIGDSSPRSLLAQLVPCSRVKANKVRASKRHNWHACKVYSTTAKATVKCR